MSKFDDRLQQIFNVDPAELDQQLNGLPDQDGQDQDNREYEPLVPVVYDEVETSETDDGSDRFNDYKYTRQTLHGLIERGMIALESSLHLAQESEHPRAFEVSATIMKSVADMSKDLMGLHDKKGTPAKIGSQTNNQYNINMTPEASQKEENQELDRLLSDLDDVVDGEIED